MNVRARLYDYTSCPVPGVVLPADVRQFSVVAVPSSDNVVQSLFCSPTVPCGVFLLPDVRPLSGSCCAGAVADVVCGDGGVQLYPLPDCCHQGDRIRLPDTGLDGLRLGNVQYCTVRYCGRVYSNAIRSLADL